MLRPQTVCQFTVASSVACPLNRGEADGGLVLQTFPFMCKSCYPNKLVNLIVLQVKNWKVYNKTSSPLVRGPFLERTGSEDKF